MNFEQVIETLDDDVYQRLKTAVELGKWPNGQALTQPQKEISLQAVIAYENRHVPSHQRIGHIERKKTTPCGHGDGGLQADVPLRWK